MRRSDFGKRVKNLRKEVGLKQAEAAKKIGVGYRTYQGYEAGDFPSQTNLQKLVGFFGCRREWLLTGQEPIYKKDRASSELVNNGDSGDRAGEISSLNSKHEPDEEMSSEHLKLFNELLCEKLEKVTNENKRLKAKLLSLETKIKNWQESRAQSDSNSSNDRRVKDRRDEDRSLKVLLETLNVGNNNLGVPTKS